MAEAGPSFLKRYFPVVTSTLLLASLAATFWPGLSNSLVYDRAALREGELWRLLTGHLVHFSPIHWAFNALVLGVAGFLVERQGTRRIVGLYLSLATGISVGLFLVHPQMAFFGGLSGIAVGILFTWALWGIQAHQPFPWLPWIVVVFLPIKVGWEHYWQTSVLTLLGNQSFQPMPSSHLFGCLIALGFYGVVRHTCRSSSSAGESGEKNSGS